MKAVHIICHRNAAGSLNGLTHLGSGVYESGCWLLTDEARTAIGGWVYFHPRKTARSEFGGQILTITPGKREAAIEDGYVIRFRAARECLGQAWRGRNDKRAWLGVA